MIKIGLELYIVVEKRDGDIGGFMKELFRYSTSAMGIIIGVAVALLSLFYADYMKRLNVLENCEKENLSYNYQYAFSVSLTTQKDFEHLSNLFQESPITIISEDVSLYVNQEYTEHLCRVIFSQKEELNYQLCEGRFPTDAEIEAGKQVVILGNSLKNCTYSKNDKDYIQICGDEYLVTGYCAGKVTTVGNYSILLFAGCLGEHTQMDVWRAGNTYMRTYSMNSDFPIARDLYLDLKTELEKSDIQIGNLYEYQSDFNGSQYRENYLKLSYQICIISMIITLTVIRFWLFQRQYEFAVRRIYGYSEMGLYMLITRELAELLCISFMLSMILYSGIGCIYYLVYDIWMPVVAKSIFPSLFIIFAIIVTVVIFTVWNTFNRSSLAAYRKG